MFTLGGYEHIANAVLGRSPHLVVSKVDYKLFITRLTLLMGLTNHSYYPPWNEQLAPTKWMVGNRFLLGQNGLFEVALAFAVSFRGCVVTTSKSWQPWSCLGRHALVGWRVEEKRPRHCDGKLYHPNVSKWIGFGWIRSLKVNDEPFDFGFLGFSPSQKGHFYEELPGIWVWP